jgi:hypothetical protein
MAKIVRNKATGQLGCVLIEINTKRWDVVFEDGSYEQYSPEDLEVVGETDLLRIPPPPATETTQQEVVASALAAIEAFKEERV